MAVAAVVKVACPGITGAFFACFSYKTHVQPVLIIIVVDLCKTKNIVLACVYHGMASCVCA